MPLIDGPKYTELAGVVADEEAGERADRAGLDELWIATRAQCGGGWRCRWRNGRRRWVVRGEWGLAATDLRFVLVRRRRRRGGGEGRRVVRMRAGLAARRARLLRWRWRRGRPRVRCRRRRIRDGGRRTVGGGGRRCIGASRRRRISASRRRRIRSGRRRCIGGSRRRCIRRWGRGGCIRRGRWTVGALRSSGCGRRCVACVGRGAGDEVWADSGAERIHAFGRAKARAIDGRGWREACLRSGRAPGLGGRAVARGGCWRSRLPRRSGGWAAVLRGRRGRRLDWRPPGRRGCWRDLRRWRRWRRAISGRGSCSRGQGIAAGQTKFAGGLIRRAAPRTHDHVKNSRARAMPR